MSNLALTKIQKLSTRRRCLSEEKIRVVRIFNLFTPCTSDVVDKE